MTCISQGREKYYKFSFDASIPNISYLVQEISGIFQNCTQPPLTSHTPFKPLMFSLLIKYRTIIIILLLLLVKYQTISKGKAAIGLALDGNCTGELLLMGLIPTDRSLVGTALDDGKEARVGAVEVAALIELLHGCQQVVGARYQQRRHTRRSLTKLTWYCIRYFCILV